MPSANVQMVIFFVALGLPIIAGAMSFP